MKVSATIGVLAEDSDWLDLVLPTVVAAIVLGLWLFWIGNSGGYAETVWYPSALVMMALWVVTMAWRRRVLPSLPIARVALLLFAALVAFNYLTIAWAGSQGSALDSSNQLTLYLLGAWVLALLPWTPPRLAAFAGLWSVGVCALCVAALLDADQAASLTRFFANDRFATPMQYSNATGALGVMGMWPLLVLSSRRELPATLRAGCLTVGTFLATFAVLPESRAALFGMIVTAPLAVVVSSDRCRLLVRLLIGGGAVAFCLPRIIAVNDAVDAGRNVTPVLRHASVVMAAAAVVAGVIGLVVALVEDRWRPPVPGIVVSARAQMRRSKRQLTIGTSALAVVVVIVGLVVAWPHITQLVHQTVAKGNVDETVGSNRFLSTSPEERLDYYRVALHLFSGNPVGGIGSANFGRRYDGLRKFAKHSMYVHDLPLRVLAETGLIGTVLFVLLIVALVVGMVSLARRRKDLGRACVTIAFAVSGYFLVHSLFDWVDAFPALAAPAIGLPFAALELGSSDRLDNATDDELPGRPGRPGRPGWVRWLGFGALALGGVAMFLAVATAYLSLVSINRAFAVYRTDPDQAYKYLRIARTLAPLSVNPLTSEGTIALYAGDVRRSEDAFRESVRKENDWYPRLELALMFAHSGHFPEAMAQLDQAARLDIHDPLIEIARERIRHHVRINPISFNARIEQVGNSSALLQQTIR